MTSRLLVAAIVTCVAGPAIAEVSLEVSPHKGAPAIVARIANEGRVPTSRITLVDERGTVVPAASVVDWRDTDESLAIAFVIASQEVWVGNDDIEPEDSAARYLGALKALRETLDAVDLAHTTPAGSLGALITYDDRANLRVPLGPIAQLTGKAFGTQRDYYMHVGTSLVAGIHRGMEELERAHTVHKLLIVIGDGNDTDNDVAKGQLALLKKQAAQHRISTAAIIYKGQLSSSENVVTTFAPNAFTVTSATDITTATRSVLQRFADRYQVTFPGARLQWDGRVQDLAVHLDRDELEPVAIRMGPARPTPSPAFLWVKAWWMQLAAGAGLVGLIALTLRLRAHSRPPTYS